MNVKGKDLAGLGVPAEEPVVLVRGDDPFAPHMLRDYAARLFETGQPDPAHAALDHADRIKAWQNRRQQGAPELAAAVAQDEVAPQPQAPVAAPDAPAITT